MSESWSCLTILKGCFSLFVCLLGFLCRCRCVFVTVLDETVYCNLVPKKKKSFCLCLISLFLSLREREGEGVGE